MKKIEAIIRHERLQEVQDALDQLGVSGLTVSEVVGCGRQKGYTEQYRGVRANISLLPKIKVESVVPSDIVDSAVEAIVGAARTGNVGDGRVFVYAVEQSIRIRTREDGEESVRHEEPVGWGHWQHDRPGGYASAMNRESEDIAAKDLKFGFSVMGLLILGALIATILS